MCFEESSSDLILGKSKQVLSSSVHSNRASIVSFIRDLGTTLSHLHVLWMACCGLLDLDGISACSSLKVSINAPSQTRIWYLSSLDVFSFTVDCILPILSVANVNLLMLLFPSAEELYIAYNKISDLCPLSFLDHLEVLDLEGNDIEDINQMQYLGLCCKLSSLTVEGNLICLKPSAESAEVRAWFI